MARESDDVVDVELVEVDGPHEPLGHAEGARHEDAAGAAAGPAQRGRARAWWVGAGVLAVLAVAVVASNVVAARTAAERREAIGAWAVPALDRPLQEVWRAADRTVVGTVPGTVLLQSSDALEAVDPVSGVLQWSLPTALGEFCSASTRQGWYLAEPPRGDPLVLCRSEGNASDAGFGSLELRSIDPRTGAVLATVSRPDAALIGQPTASDVLLLGSADGVLVVERLDLRSGASVWRHEEAGPTDLDGFEGLSLQPLPTVFVLSIGSRTIGLAMDSGEEVEDPLGAGVVVARWELSGGRAVEVVLDPDADGGARTRLVDAEGRETEIVTGVPVTPVANDGRLDVVCLQLLTSQSGPGNLAGVDARTGEERWRDEAGDDGSGFVDTPLMQVDGRLLVVGGMAALRDLDTGKEAWRLPLSAVVTVASPVTDGDVVVLPVSADHGEIALVAVALADGSERWRVAAPDGTSVIEVAPRDGVVLVSTSAGEVVALRSE